MTIGNLKLDAVDAWKLVGGAICLTLSVAAIYYTFSGEVAALGKTTLSHAKRIESLEKHYVNSAEEVRRLRAEMRTEFRLQRCYLSEENEAERRRCLLQVPRAEAGP